MPVDDDADDGASSPGWFGAPLPPEDRLWRHPSELGAVEPVAPWVPATGRRPAPWGVALVSGLIGAVLAVGLVVVVDSVRLDADEKGAATSALLQTGSTTLRTAVTLAPAAGGVVELAHSVGPAIVGVHAEASAGTATGSGVLIRDDGYLVTNAHVVQGADRVAVVLAGGDEVTARVVGLDPVTDIAVLRVPRRQLTVADLGTATALQVGQPAIAIGSPVGASMTPSVTVGVISALGRRVQGASGQSLHDMIETDAPTMPGSSGGVLLDAAGSVVGITTAVVTSDDDAEGLGFATPIDVVRTVADDIIATGEAHHVWLGIEGNDLEPARAADLDLAGGATVERVLDASPAAVAGLAEGDVIVAIDDAPVRSMSALIVALRAHRPGDSVVIRYVRRGSRGFVPLTLMERPG